MGPAPAVAEVRHAVRQALAELSAAPLFVACSGGADSLALACAVAFERDLLGLRIGVRTLRGSAPTLGHSGAAPLTGLVTIDHQLQEGSAEQARHVAAIGYELGFDPVVSVSVQVRASDGPEADARSARYAALDQVADAHGALVVLGHTLDDQAETVLLGLGRGSGPRSVAGMSPRSGRYLRPLLSVRRGTTVAACQALDLPYWNDPHNEDERYTRVGIRRLIPMLDEVLHGGVVEALARTAAQTRQEVDALDAIAARRYAGLHAIKDPQVPGKPRMSDFPDTCGSQTPATLDVAALAAEPAAVRHRLVKLWIADVLSPQTLALTAAHHDAIDALVVRWTGQGAVNLPHGFVLRRQSGRLVLATSLIPQRRPRKSAKE